jgi:cytochrome c biogenesis protein CcmG, thiol:disulfide interchange protein DsbE
MSTRKALSLLGIMAALSVVLYYFVAVRGPVTAPSSDIGAVSRGQMAPDFQLKDLSGRPVSLEDFRGQIVLVNFWASWCQPCLDEMPSLQALYAKFKDRKFVVLAVNLNETAPDLEAFLKKNGVTFPVLCEGQAIAQRYGTEKVPESYLIDNRGVVLQKIIGAQDWLQDSALKYFDELLPKAAS